MPSKRLLELINKFSKVVVYKTQLLFLLYKNSVVFLYTNSELAEKEMGKAILFPIASKNNIQNINLIPFPRA
jgi:hypothetical protein